MAERLQQEIGVRSNSDTNGGSSLQITIATHTIGKESPVGFGPLVYGVLEKLATVEGHVNYGESVNSIQ